MPTALPCVAFCLIARIWAVRVGAPPVPKSWTPPLAPAAYVPAVEGEAVCGVVTCTWRGTAR